MRNYYKNKFHLIYGKTVYYKFDFLISDSVYFSLYFLDTFISIISIHLDFHDSEFGSESIFYKISVFYKILRSVFVNYDFFWNIFKLKDNVSNKLRYFLLTIFCDDFSEII